VQPFRGTTMGLVKAFVVPGYELRMYSNDHAPPHFHVAPNALNFELRVYFLETTADRLAVDMVYPPNRPPEKLLPSNIRKILIRLVIRHRVELLEQWTQTHS
jgi:hypothetical protein